jgi:hypothetical protein
MQFDGSTLTLSDGVQISMTNGVIDGAVILISITSTKLTLTLKTLIFLTQQKKDGDFVTQYLRVQNMVCILEVK